MALNPVIARPIALPPLAEFRPEPALRVVRTSVTRPAAPIVDAHNHLGRWLASWVGRGGAWVVDDVGTLLALMDAWRVEAIVNLDGRWGSELESNLDRYDRAHPGRFATFCHVDWSSAFASGDVGAFAARSLRESVDAGARGVKVWKDLGLLVRDL